MAKKKSKKQSNAPENYSNSAVVPHADASGAISLPSRESLNAGRAETSSTKSKKTPKIVKQWDQYFGKGDLEDWQRLCRDVGLKDDLPSKNQCRKALKKVNINIKDFLAAMKKSEPVLHFPTAAALSRYTIRTQKIFPKKHARAMGPVATLLKLIFRESKHD